MKENLLQRWCDKAWLYCLYLIGIVMSVILIMNWGNWDSAQKVIGILAVLIPLHVFEENTVPGGFFFMNNLEQKSDAPLVYPQNRLTNMITNLDAEILVIILVANATKMEAILVVFAIAFGVGELFHHIRGGIDMLERYKNKGKTTIYGPGTITSIFCLLPLGIYCCYWLSQHSFTVIDVLLGIAIMAAIAICLILLPFKISRKVKSSKYAFKSAGYFSKYK